MPYPTDLKSAVQVGPLCDAERAVFLRGLHMGLSDAREGQAARQVWEELNSGEEFLSIKGWPRRQGTGNTWNRKQKKLDQWKLAKSLVEEKCFMLNLAGIVIEDPTVQCFFLNLPRTLTKIL